MKDIDLYELITKESFLNYCFNRNNEDITYWKNWLVAHPEYNDRIIELKAVVLLMKESGRKKIIDKNFTELEQKLINPTKVKKNNTIMALWPRVSIAAAILLVISSIGFFYSGLYNTKDDQKLQLMDQILPGKNGATLTLGNGKKIYISDQNNGQIAEQAGVKISKTAHGDILYEIKERAESSFEYNMIETKYGEQAQVILPDHSRIFLNAGSSLKYPSNFAVLNDRKVTLKGEAYFEVTPNQKKPFIVVTDNQEVRVLGTHFNISGYFNEETKTTLLEGSVRIKVLNDRGRLGQVNNTVVLAPGEQSILSTEQLKIVEVDISKGIDWKNGDFVFKNEKLASIMRKIARWYNVDIVYSNNAPLDLTLSGAVSRSKKITSVLRLIESTGKVQFNIKGRTVMVSR